MLLPLKILFGKMHCYKIYGIVNCTEIKNEA